MDGQDGQDYVICRSWIQVFTGIQKARISKILSILFIHVKENSPGRRSNLAIGAPLRRRSHWHVDVGSGWLRRGRDHPAGAGVDLRPGGCCSGSGPFPAHRDSYPFLAGPRLHRLEGRGLVRRRFHPLRHPGQLHFHRRRHRPAHPHHGGRYGSPGGGDAVALDETGADDAVGLSASGRRHPGSWPR